MGRNPDVYHIGPIREFVERDDADIGDAYALDSLISRCASGHRNADVGTIGQAVLRALISAG